MFEIPKGARPLLAGEVVAVNDLMRIDKLCDRINHSGPDCVLAKGDPKWDCGQGGHVVQAHETNRYYRVEQR